MLLLVLVTQVLVNITDCSSPLYVPHYSLATMERRAFGYAGPQACITHFRTTLDAVISVSKHLNDS